MAQKKTNRRRKRKKSLWRRMTPLCRGLIIGSGVILVICIAMAIAGGSKKDNNEVKQGSTVVSNQTNSNTQLETQPVATSAASNYGKKNIVCIDAGHGGSDGGAAANGVVEKDQDLMMAELVKQNLESAGITVILTRDSDTDVSLEQRVATANASEACLIVSIHRNTSEADKSASGVEAWIAANNPVDANQLATGIINKLTTDVSGFNNRGVKTGTMNNPKTNYYINGFTNMTSMILELGFITSDKDNDIIMSQRSACAKAISDGIIDYTKTLK